MREFNFEYSDRRLTIKLLLYSYAIFLVVLAFLIYQHLMMAALISFFFLVLAPLLIILFFKKQIKANGTACINENSVELKLRNINETIQFGDIKSYMVQVYQGFMIRLRLNNGRKVRIDANENFCNPQQFSLFCDSLEQSLDKLQVAREKSFFEKKGTYYFLVVMTVLIVVGVIVAFIFGKRQPSSFFISAFAIVTLWASYYTTKLRNKKRANSNDISS